MFTKDQKKELLHLARKAVENRLKGRVFSATALTAGPPPEEPPGLFVTLTKHGELRGCIGTLERKKPLAEDVARFAVEAAFQDPRFLPLDADEFPHVLFEISLLSPLKRIASIDEIQPGKHGVHLKNGLRKGVFLPQVWEEMPEKEVFLNALCTQKAGMEERCWLADGTELSVFTVEKFSDTAL